MKVFVIFVLIGFVSISTIMSENPVHGLECEISTMSDHFEYADVVFLGTALSKDYQPNPRHEDRFDAVTLFSVIEPYKGIYQKTVNVTSSEWFWGVNFTENRDYVVFANNYENLEHALCTPTQLTTNSDLDEVRKISKNYILPPLVQMKFDIQFDQIQCKQNLVLLQKYDGSPACVTEPTKLKLIERGWAEQKSQDMKTTLTPYCTNPLYVLDPDTNTCIINKTLPKCTDNTTSDTVIQHCRVSVTCDKEFDPDTMGSDVSLLPQCTPLRDCPDGFQFGIFPVNGDEALCEREDRKIHAGVYYPYEKQMLATSGIDHNQNDIHSKPINLNGTKEQRTIQISVITSGWYEKLGHPTVTIESNGNQIEQLVMDLKKTEPGQTIHGIEHVLSEDLPDGTITIRINMPEYDLLPSQSFDVKHISE